MYLPSDSRLDLPGEGPLFELDFKKWLGGGQNMDTIPVAPWAIIYIRPGPLVRYGTGVKSLSNVAEYCYHICLKTSKKFEVSLCKLLCISSG